MDRTVQTSDLSSLLDVFPSLTEFHALWVMGSPHQQTDLGERQQQQPMSHHSNPPPLQGYQVRRGDGLSLPTVLWTHVETHSALEPPLVEEQASQLRLPEEVWWPEGPRNPFQCPCQMHSLSLRVLGDARTPGCFFSLSGLPLSDAGAFLHTLHVSFCQPDPGKALDFRSVSTLQSVQVCTTLRCLLS